MAKYKLKTVSNNIELGNGSFDPAKEIISDIECFYCGYTHEKVISRYCDYGINRFNCVKCKRVVKYEITESPCCVYYIIFGSSNSPRAPSKLLKNVYAYDHSTRCIKFTK